MLNAFVYVRSDPYRTRGRTNGNVHVITISFHPLRNFIVSFASLRTINLKVKKLIKIDFSNFKDFGFFNW